MVEQPIRGQGDGLGGVVLHHGHDRLHQRHPRVGAGNIAHVLEPGAGLARFACAGQANPGAFVDAGGDLERQRLVLLDATGAVAVAGAALGDEALEVAATVKMIQNILIGVTAFFVAAYWVAYVEKDSQAAKPGVGEIWYRFPKFVLGFIGASILFSVLHASLAGGDLMIVAMIKGSTKTLRGWFFCLAFVCIGVETNFKQLVPYCRGGKPMVLYVCGQTLNLVLTLLMAYLMFGVLFAGETQ